MERAARSRPAHLRPGRDRDRVFVRVLGATAALAAAAGACGGGRPPPPPAGPPVLAPAAAGALRSPDDFLAIADPAARSRALFLEISRVLTHPRCVNCHPADDSPRQGDDALRHDPPVARGPDGRGVPGLHCGSCHQDRNLDHARVPGAPDWHLAPATMAWLGVEPAAICLQLKDPARTGGKGLPAIAHHLEHDPLVAWGFAPGADRAAPPGSPAAVAALARAWIETGAHCPPPTATPAGGAP